MSGRATVWWLLAALTVMECWAAIPSKRQTFPNIENGWPLSDKDVEEGGDFVIQMPSCLAVQGVCAPRQNCQEEYIHETSDLCGEQADTVCCLTRSAFEKHVLQLKSCADTGSVCAFEEDCPEQDRHSNPLLCGDQLGVTCCKILPQNIPGPRPRRAHKVQLFSCEDHGGICRQEEQCPGADRLGNSDMCGDQPFITCCQASDTDSPVLPFEETKKRSEDKKSFDLKYKRRAHSVQIESCEAQGGICRQKDQCESEDRMGTSDLCGDHPSITCCQVTNLNRPSPYKRTPQLNEKRRAHSVQIESCEAQGGICRQADQCESEDRMGTSDLCGDQPSITCCRATNANRPSLPIQQTLQEKKKRRAHSVQIESCKDQGGICQQKDQCPEDSRLGTFDSCGDNPFIACCQLQSSEKRSPELLPSLLQKKRQDIGPQRPNYLPATLCESKGGTCKQESQCSEQNRLGSSDMCADEPNVICCIVSSKEPIEEITKRRAHSVQIESCKAQGGICQQKDQCPEDSRLGTFDSCGDNPLIACCQLQSSEKRSPEPLPSLLQKKRQDIGPQRPNYLPATLCESKGGTCKQESQCSEQDRLGSSDMCADEPDVICCIFSSRNPTEERNKRRAHSVQIESCKAQGGICKHKDQCPEDSRLGTFDSCGDNPLIACCQLPSQLNEISSEKRSPEMFPSLLKTKRRDIGPQRPNYLPATLCESKGGTCKQESQCSEQNRLGSSDMCADEPDVICCILSSNNLDSIERINKRRAHSVQIESCKDQGGICKQKDQCLEDSRLGTFDSCGDNPLIACCQLQSQLNEISSEKRSPELFPSLLLKKRQDNGPHRPDYFPESFEESNTRRAHSVQHESCRAQSGMCTYVSNCPAKEQLGEAMCGGLANITCCHLPFLESAMSQDKQSADVVPEKEASANGSDGKEKRGAAIPIHIKTCKAQGGVCKKKNDCLQEDYIDASDICGLPYELIYTCCRVSNVSVTKRRAHSVQLESCRAQDGMCRQTDQCPETDRLGSDSCGNLPYITCCKRSGDALTSGAEPRMIGIPSLNLECLMRGGLCKRNVDCFPEDRYENIELCGSQAGVSCCKRLPPGVGECSARGGECVPESVCQNGPRDKFGQCSGGDVCCIWIT